QGGRDIPCFVFLVQVGALSLLRETHRVWISASQIRCFTGFQGKLCSPFIHALQVWSKCFDAILVSKLWFVILCVCVCVCVISPPWQAFARGVKRLCLAKSNA
ncbi:unnamed protein product, partial [Choristocarpus tenellus]